MKLTLSSSSSGTKMPKLKDRPKGRPIAKLAARFDYFEIFISIISKMDAKSFCENQPLTMMQRSPTVLHQSIDN